jgi:hypothetical protein
MRLRTCSLLLLLSAAASAQNPPITVHRAAAFDVSAPLAAASVEQTAPGERPPMAMIAGFDGLGVGFNGPQGTATGRNPSDNSLAAGPDHIVEIVNSRMAVYTKTGKVLYGAAPTNTLFKGFGGPCEARNNGDAVVRYDQLAGRWLYVMPLFSRIPGRTEEPYSMCYALSTGPDPLGPYYRYEFRRKLFPDYPRPAVWIDGYYIPTSTGDTVIQKHACVVDRAKMLVGGDATEQCLIIDGVNFLNNADIDGLAVPPPGAPNIIMAAGGTQLKKVLEDDGIYAWQMHVDWETPANTKLTGPVKIPVAPYRYLCGGQLTNCVPQPGSTRRLDAQGDKIMQRLVYRNLGGHESIVGLHSVDTAAGGGGVRWYEFRLDDKRQPYLFQQGTYAPDGLYRWMGSIGMDRAGNIAMGYSYGGATRYPGQRFAGRLANDPPGILTFRETVLVEGEDSQQYGNRWEDYATLAMDPSDDCTFWYVGDYVKKGAASYTTRIGAFRMPGCLAATVSGSAYLDLNGNSRRDSGEPGLPGREVAYTGGQPGKVTTDLEGNFTARVPADPAYFEPAYRFGSVELKLRDRQEAMGIDVPVACAPARGRAKPPDRAALMAHDPAWRAIVRQMTPLKLEGTPKQAYDEFRAWLAKEKEKGGVVVSALNCL